MLLVYVSSMSTVPDLLSGLSSSTDVNTTRGIIAGSAVYVIWGLAVFPPAWYCKEQLLKRHTHLVGWRDHLYVVFVELVIGSVGGSVLLIARKVRDLAHGAEHNQWLAFLMGIALIWATIGILVLRRLFGPQKVQEKGEKLSIFKGTFGHLPENEGAAIVGLARSNDSLGWECDLDLVGI